MKKYIVVYFILIFSQSFAQQIQDKSRYLFIAISFQGNGGFAIIDTLIITKDSGNRTEFIIGKGFGKTEKQVLFKNGDSIYIVSENDTLLLYDYSLEAGDTFNYKTGTAESDRFAIDSSNTLMLEDGKFYRHWYLHSIGSMANFPLTWIENLGEKYSGWDYTYYKVSHTPALESICNNNQSVLWNNVMQLNKTCNFDSIAKVLNIDKPNKDNLLLYPNPCMSFIQVNLNEEFQYVIYNLYGKVISEGVSDGKIDTENIPSAIYILQLFNTETSFHLIFEKAN